MVTWLDRPECAVKSSGPCPPPGHVRLRERAFPTRQRIATRRFFQARKGTRAQNRLAGSSTTSAEILDLPAYG